MISDASLIHPFQSQFVSASSEVLHARLAEEALIRGTHSFGCPGSTRGGKRRCARLHGSPHDRSFESTLPAATDQEARTPPTLA